MVTTPSWIPALLAIAAVANVPLFIAGLFLLQTKFRPEMQEDSFYSKYLERKYSSSSLVKAEKTSVVDIESEFKELADRIVARVTESTEDKKEEVVQILRESDITQLKLRFNDNRSLSEIYLYPGNWPELVNQWEDDDLFKKDISDLLESGLITLKEGLIRRPQLTNKGKEIAKSLESENKLWNHSHKRQ